MSVHSSHVAPPEGKVVYRTREEFEHRMRQLRHMAQRDHFGTCHSCGDECEDYTDQGHRELDGWLYCEPCWDDMPLCQWCEEKVAPKEPAVAVADDCQYHEQCFVDYVAQEPEDARETIPELDQFLAAISARRAR